MKLNDGILGFFKNIKKEKLILIFLVGVLLVVIKLPVSNSTKNNDKSNQKSNSEYNINNDIYDLNTDYEAKMETSLKKLLSKIEGVGEVEVAITLKDSGKNVYNYEEHEGGSKKTELKKYPEINGVLIIAYGADNMEIVDALTKASSALLGISVNKIKVMKMEA